MSIAANENAGRASGGFPEPVQLATPSVRHGAQVRKALAVMFYNIGARSLAETQAEFDRHPEWRVV